MWPHMLGAAEKDMTQSSKIQVVLMAAKDVNCAYLIYFFATELDEYYFYLYIYGTFVQYFQ